MANSINSISTGTGGLQSTADGTSGNLLIQKDAGTIATFSATGVVVSGVVAATTLTGDGSALTGIASGGLTLLSTVATTSGTEIVASGLDLSTYKVLIFWAYSVGVASGGTPGLFQWKETGGTNSIISTKTIVDGEPYYGNIYHNLTNGTTGVFGSSYYTADNAANLVFYAGSCGMSTNTAIDTATTSITFSTVGAQTFDLGQILIYGLK
tara:strand:+ start:67 stop:696 length:630 start_codon:yes stop_codon:yes gene_type:complete